MKCEGCGKPLGKIEALHFSVCMECTIARQKAVVKRKCVCGPRKIALKVCQVGSRRWIPCKRCLGTIKQLS